MNSITPIASLASTVNEMLVDMGEPSGDGVTATETISDVRNAMRTIERRSQSLLSFVNAYRSLTRIPKPDFRIIPIQELFDNVALLMRPQMEARGISFVCSVEPESLDLTADPELIEQVLINLLKNAMEAVEGIPGGEVRVAARIDERGRTTIQVIDNGPGIVEEAIDKIFIPFFTTKKEGSGIGLSLSRQIMRQHGGTLSVLSEPDARTVFTLRF
jgi:signal transduction histidine kinase